MIALCDMDSLLYILSYNFREHMDIPGADIDIQRAADDFVKSILMIVQADSYVGVFSPDKNFRHEVYKYAKYKGERPPKPDWFERFAPVIKSRLIEKWGFFTVPDLEADDVICALAEYYSKSVEMVPKTNARMMDVIETHSTEWIICSPDKDLRQIAGLHYDYKKEGAVPFSVGTQEASFNFHLQMLMGDDSDCVRSIPGLGIAKATKLLKDCDDPMMWGTIVMAQYVKYFGNYYGPIIYQETKDTLQLMSSKHRLWYQFQESFIHMFSATNYREGHIEHKFNNTLEEDSPFIQAADEIQSVLDHDLADPFCMGLGMSSEQQEKKSWGSPDWFETTG